MFFELFSGDSCTRKGFRVRPAQLLLRASFLGRLFRNLAWDSTQILFYNIDFLFIFIQGVDPGFAQAS